MKQTVRNLLRILNVEVFSAAFTLATMIVNSLHDVLKDRPAVLHAQVHLLDELVGVHRVASHQLVVHTLLISSLHKSELHAINLAEH